MRRILFFWLEQMKITPAERRAVAGSLLLLLLLLLVNASVTPPDDRHAAYYRALEEEFARRAAVIARREAEINRRYDPPRRAEGTGTGGPVPVSPFLPDTLDPDTLTPDTLSADSLHRGESPAPERIDLNSAGPEELQELPGIGPVYAERIIRRRNEAGPFQAVGELLQIRGIGKKRLEKIKPFVKI